MVAFNLWTETFIFAAIFSFIIIIPCVLVALMGRNMIERLGRWPTDTPAIQLSVLLKLIALEVVTFGVLILFYMFFAG